MTDDWIDPTPTRILEVVGEDCSAGALIVAPVDTNVDAPRARPRMALTKRVMALAVQQRDVTDLKF